METNVQSQTTSWPKGDQFQQAGELSAAMGLECPHCGRIKGQWRGYRSQKHETVHRRWCSVCGRWFIGSPNVPVNRAEDRATAKELLDEKLWYESWREAYDYQQEMQALAVIPSPDSSRTQDSEIREELQKR